MEVALSRRFRRQWNRLPAAAQVQVARGLQKLRDGRGRRKGITTRPRVFELRVAGDLRLLWTYAGPGRIEVHEVVTHRNISANS